MPKRGLEHRLYSTAQRAHHRIRSSACIRPRSSSVHNTGTSVTAITVAAEHGERLRERERMKQLPFLPGQREHGHEGQHDDRHREEHGPPDQARRLAHGLAHATAVVADRCPAARSARNAFSVTTMPASTSTPMAIAMPARLIRLDVTPAYAHRQERHQHRQRQRQRDDENRPEVQQEDDVRERDEQDLLEERDRSVPSDRDR